MVSSPIINNSKKKTHNQYNKNIPNLETKDNVCSYLAFEIISSIAVALNNKTVLRKR